MSFSKIKPSNFLAALFLLSLVVGPPLLSQGLLHSKINVNPKNFSCSWKKPSSENCPDSNWIVKKDSQGCPYLYCLKPRKVLGEKDNPQLVKLSLEKETFSSGETITVKMKNLSGRRINLPEKISWQIKKITNQKESSIFSQQAPTAGLSNFERNQVFKFLWDQKDQRGKSVSPGNYQFVTTVEDQTFTTTFSINKEESP